MKKRKLQKRKNRERRVKKARNIRSNNISSKESIENTEKVDTHDNGVIKFLALLVKTVLIIAPFRFKKRIISKLLYAEIPPQIIRSIFFSNKLFIILLFEYYE